MTEKLHDDVYWTKKIPTEPEFYWWRQDAAWAASIVRLDAKGSIWFTGNEVEELASALGGEWAGPLTPPGGDAIEKEPA